jgi:dUTP pyrophosphatase
MHCAIKRLDHSEGLPFPKAGTEKSAGLDLAAAIGAPITLAPMARALIPTGFCIQLPDGCEGQIRSRSGLSFNNGVVVLNAPGTIDADYTGEIKVLLINFGSEPFVIERGMRIAQLVVARHETITWHAVDDFEEEAQSRSSSGFGSTGLFNHG